jgi:hypothetical protein
MRAGSVQLFTIVVISALILVIALLMSTLQQTPTFASQSALGGTNLTPSSNVTVGTSVTASVSLTLSGGAGPFGLISFSIYSGACNSGGVPSGSPLWTSNVQVTSTGTHKYTSPSFNTFSLIPGVYSWIIYYTGTGPTGYPRSPGSGYECEPMTVSKAVPYLSTGLSATSVPVGSQVKDSATLTGSTPDAGGYVTYYLFSGVGCSGTGTQVSKVPVSFSAVPDSVYRLFSSAGSFSWQAVYGGDSKNAGATSSCEGLSVEQLKPTLHLALNATTITAGDSVSASSSLTGAASGAGGEISFYFSASSSCPVGSATQLGSPVSVSGSGVYYSSASQSFSSPGDYYWYAVYSGDANDAGATSLCVQLTVLAPFTTTSVPPVTSLVATRASPTLSTSLSSTIVIAGGSVYDTATLTNGLNPSGFVLYYLFFNGQCAGSSLLISNVTVTSGSIPSSAPYTLNSVGSYSFQAVYSGDSNNQGAVSSCEPLSVVPTPAGVPEFPFGLALLLLFALPALLILKSRFAYRIG